MQTIVCYVENKPGVLNRVASLTRRLAINIDSLTVGPTENEEIARMTICAHTDENGARRLEASLEKLVDVLLAENISDRSMLERDLALIKVAADHMRPASPDGTGESVSRARGGCLARVGDRGSFGHDRKDRWLAGSSASVRRVGNGPYRAHRHDQRQRRAASSGRSHQSFQAQRHCPGIQLAAFHGDDVDRLL